MQFLRKKNDLQSPANTPLGIHEKKVSSQNLGIYSKFEKKNDFWPQTQVRGST